MIEVVMLAALGFLGATVIWLITLPAISRRADRLARRRAELSFPLSVDEIAAERDHLRATFAVRERELERKAERSQAERASALAAAGARDMAIAELKTTLAVREVMIADRDAGLATLDADLEATRAALASESTQHVATQRDLATRGHLLLERDREVAALMVERSDLRATLAARIQDLDEATACGERLDAELASKQAALEALETAHAALNLEKDRLRLALAQGEMLAMNDAARIAELDAMVTELTAALSGEQGGHAATRAAFERRGSELAALVAERNSLRVRLKASEDAAARLDQMLNDTRQARSTAEQSGAAARQEAEAIGSRLREVTADKARLEAEAASARRERDLRIEALRGDLDAEQSEAGKVRAQRAALADELGALRRETERAAQRMDAENARLRAEISHVAEQFLKLRSGSALRLAPEHDGVGAARSLDAASAPQDHAQPRQKVAFSKPLSLPPVPDAAVE